MFFLKKKALLIINIHLYIYIHIDICIYIYMYIPICIYRFRSIWIYSKGQTASCEEEDTCVI